MSDDLTFLLSFINVSHILGGMMEETENLVNNIVHLAALLHFDRYRNRNRAFVCYVFSDLFYYQCSPTYLPTLSSPGLRCWGLESYEAG